jgi:hypothetical protein
MGLNRIGEIVNIDFSYLLFGWRRELKRWFSRDVPFIQYFYPGGSAWSVFFLVQNAYKLQSIFFSFLFCYISVFHFVSNCIYVTDLLVCLNLC